MNSQEDRTYLTIVLVIAITKSNSSKIYTKNNHSSFTIYCHFLEEKPSCWDKMLVDSNGKEVHVHLVTLQTSSPEYKDVESKFNVTMTGRYSQILSIQRLQNPILYGQYVSRRKEMDKRNPSGHKNELYLWHGTASQNLNNINTQGFNRSFQGTHGNSEMI